MRSFSVLFKRTALEATIIEDKLIKSADRYLLPIVLVIIIASVMPTVIHIHREKEDRKEIIEGLKKIRARLFKKTTES